MIKGHEADDDSKSFEEISASVTDKSARDVNGNASRCLRRYNGLPEMIVEVGLLLSGINGNVPSSPSEAVYSKSGVSSDSLDS